MRANDNTLLIMKYIKEALKNDEELGQLMDTNKIWPLVANEGTSYPFIIYSRESMTPEYTKPYGGWTDDITFNITVYSNDYEEGVIIANTVRHILEWRRLKNDYINTEEIELIAAVESFSNDYGYMQVLTFRTNGI